MKGVPQAETATVSAALWPCEPRPFMPLPLLWKSK